MENQGIKTTTIHIPIKLATVDDQVRTLRPASPIADPAANSGLSRSNSMRTSRWDAKLPKQLEGRPPLKPLRKQMSRSLSPRPRGPVGLSMLRPPPPSPSGGNQEGTSSPLLLPTRSPTPPQALGATKQLLIINKPLSAFSHTNSGTRTGWSSAPTTPTSLRKTLEVPSFKRPSDTPSSPKCDTRIPRKVSNKTSTSPSFRRSVSTSPSRFQTKPSIRSSDGGRGVSLSTALSRPSSNERNIGGFKTLTPPTRKRMESPSKVRNASSDINIRSTKSPSRSSTPIRTSSSPRGSGCRTPTSSSRSASNCRKGKGRLKKIRKVAILTEVHTRSQWNSFSGFFIVCGLPTQFRVDFWLLYFILIQ